MFTPKTLGGFDGRMIIGVGLIDRHPELLGVLKIPNALDVH